MRKLGEVSSWCVWLVAHAGSKAKTWSYLSQSHLMSQTYSQTLNGFPLVAKVETLSTTFRTAPHLAAACLCSRAGRPLRPLPSFWSLAPEHDATRSPCAAIEDPCTLFWLLLGVAFSLFSSSKLLMLISRAPMPTLL